MTADPISEEAQTYLRVALAGQHRWAARHASLALSSSATLQAFLQHVRATVPFYRRLDIPPGPRGIFLDDCPVVTRDMMAADPDDFVSTAFHRDTATYFAFTNGTVQRKLRVGFDLAGWFDFNYGFYTHVAERVPGLTRRLTPGSEAVVLVVDNPAARPMRVVLPTLDGALLRQLVIGGEPGRDRADVEDLRTAPIPVLYGRPSTLRELAAVDAGLPGTRRIRPDVVLTSGENLYPEDRRRLQEDFQAPVYDAYVATEGGLLGLECAHRRGLHIPDHRVRVEVMDNSGAIRTTGSGEVLVTTVANWGQAFVRYQVGDQGTVVAQECPCGHTGTTLARLWGADTRRYVTAGHRVDTDAIAASIQGLPVVQFQVDDRDAARLRLTWISSSGDPATIAGTHRALADRLAQRFPGVPFDVVPVTRITPRGGKARRFPRQRARAAARSDPRR